MDRKRKKRSSFGRLLIPITAIIILNFTGISYAYWTDGLDILTSISTGRIRPRFNIEHTVKKNSGTGDITIRFNDSQQEIESGEDHTVMYIEGDVNPGYTADITYVIDNYGTIPIKLIEKTVKINSGNEPPTSPSEQVINPGDSNSNSIISINAASNDKLDFIIELLYRQWN